MGKPHYRFAVEWGHAAFSTTPLQWNLLKLRYRMEYLQPHFVLIHHPSYLRSSGRHADKCFGKCNKPLAAISTSPSHTAGLAVTIADPCALGKDHVRKSYALAKSGRSYIPRHHRHMLHYKIRSNRCHVSQRPYQEDNELKVWELKSQVPKLLLYFQGPLRS